MFGITDLGLFFAGTIAIILLPGPNSLYVLTVSAKSGKRFGYAAATGVFFGDAVLMVLTALGAASVLHTNPMLYKAVRWAGAAYLGYLGLRMLASAYQTVSSRRQTDTTVVNSLTAALALIKEVTPFSAARKAFIISCLNPKAILFFLSYFVQFVDPAYEYPQLSFLILGSIVQVCSLTYLSGLIFGGIKFAKFFAGRQFLSAAMTAAVGLLFLAFAVRLAS
jgi:leucine efflux protein